MPQDQRPQVPPRRRGTAKQIFFYKLSGNRKITGDLTRAVLVRGKKENLNRVGWGEKGKQSSENNEHT